MHSCCAPRWIADAAALPPRALMDRRTRQTRRPRPAPPAVLVTRDRLATHHGLAQDDRKNSPKTSRGSQYASFVSGGLSGKRTRRRISESPTWLLAVRLEPVDQRHSPRRR